MRVVLSRRVATLFLDACRPGPVGLKKFLKKHAVGDTLAVMDSKLGNLIKEKLDIPCIYRCAALRLAVLGHSSFCMACMASLGFWQRSARTNASWDVLAGAHV